MTSGDSEIRAGLAGQAGEWFIAHQGGPLTAEQRGEFLAWLRASPLHVREYLGIARIAKVLPQAVGSDPVPLELPVSGLNVTGIRTPRRIAVNQSPPIGHRDRTRSWHRAAVLAAALAALALGVSWLARDGERFGWPRTYRTQHGQITSTRLPDGSILWLDSDSEAVVRFTSRERRVALRSGRALFEVAHVPSRQFRVEAGTTGLIAVGTRFSVDRASRSLELVVAEGTVAIYLGHPGWVGTSQAIPAEVRRVTAGFRVRSDGSAITDPAEAVDITQSLGWLEHKIIFDHRPLGAVVAEFNRYANIPIDIEDEKLKALPVTGTFDARDTDSFVAFLAVLPGVAVEREPTRIRVLRKVLAN